MVVFVDTDMNWAWDYAHLSLLGFATVIVSLRVQIAHPAVYSITKVISKATTSWASPATFRTTGEGGRKVISTHDAQLKALPSPFGYSVSCGDEESPPVVFVCSHFRIAVSISQFFVRRKGDCAVANSWKSEELSVKLVLDAASWLPIVAWVKSLGPPLAPRLVGCCSTNMISRGLI